MSCPEFDRIARRIDGYRERAIDYATRLCAIPAISPASGGEGEAAKAALLHELLAACGVREVEERRAPDPAAPCGYRPNVIARVPGADRSRTFWVMSHLDVVPAGERDKWSSDPFTVRVDGDRIYGRGTEDNGQAVVGSLLLAAALAEEGLVPPIDLGLLFVADEETGSRFGIQYVVGGGPTPFRAHDLVVVPDGGTPDGTMIEVAEKSILWLRLRVVGRSTHGSTPEKGTNAHRAAAHLAVRLDQLYRRFAAADAVFDPPISTFEPTRREANVPNVNTVPGEDVFFMDCRVLPSTPLEEVEAVVRAIADGVEREQGVKVEIAPVQRQPAAPPTAADAPIVRALAAGIAEVYGARGQAQGIGGGTVAAFLRAAGIPAAVWSRLDETLHGPDEYALLGNLLGDTKVFAHVLAHAGPR